MVYKLDAEVDKLAAVVDGLPEGERAAICCRDDGQRAGEDPGSFASGNRQLTHNDRMEALSAFAVSWLCQFPAAGPGRKLLALPGLRGLGAAGAPARRSRGEDQARGEG